MTCRHEVGAHVSLSLVVVSSSQSLLYLWTLGRRCRQTLLWSRQRFLWRERDGKSWGQEEETKEREGDRVLWRKTSITASGIICSDSVSWLHAYFSVTSSSGIIQLFCEILKRNQGEREQDTDTEKTRDTEKQSGREKLRYLPTTTLFLIVSWSLFLNHKEKDINDTDKIKNHICLEWKTWHPMLN